MKRLHKLCRRDMEKWKQARQNVGTLRYGDSDLQRYGLVDVTEELLDALNIIDRMINRLKVQNVELLTERSYKLERIQFQIWELVEQVATEDKCFPDKVCTDDQGGERIWWNDKANEVKS
jgi:hypothetical protein